MIRRYRFKNSTLLEGSELESTLPSRCYYTIRRLWPDWTISTHILVALSSEPKPAAPGVPSSVPIQVLSRPNTDQLQYLNENWRVQHVPSSKNKSLALKIRSTHLM